MPETPISKPLFRRALIKLSGEALMGEKSYGLHAPVVDRLALELRDAASLGVAICVVVGGGNIYRGVAGAAGGVDRVKGDYIGMLATVMNALAMEQSLAKAGVAVKVYSAIPMPALCEPFQRDHALADLARGRMLIFAAGTGNPFFTTDTAAALRAAEMGCDVLLKATHVDGVYSADPHNEPDAVRYAQLTYREVLARDLKVMDGAAIALARDNRIPIIVFSLWEQGNIAKVFTGAARCTIIRDGEPD